MSNLDLDYESVRVLARGIPLTLSHDVEWKLREGITHGLLGMVVLLGQYQHLQTLVT